MAFRIMGLGLCVTESLLGNIFSLIFTGPLTSEAFAEGGACDEAWIYVDPNGIDVPVKKHRINPNIGESSLILFSFPENT